MRLTDMADELYTATTDLPGGVRAATAKTGRRDGDAGGDRPGGPREAPGAVRHAGSPQRQCAGRAGRRGHRAGSGRAAGASAAGGAGAGAGRGQPPGHRRRLGPRTVQKIFVTMGAGRPPVKGIRPVAAVAPGVSASIGLSLQQLAGALVREVRPTALICVDSLCSSEPQRLGRTLQFSDTGPLPGPARQQQASGRGPSGPASDRGGHPHPDDGAGGQRPRGDAPGTGQRHRPRGRPAGRGH